MAFHPIDVTVEVAIKATMLGNERANIIHYNYGVSGPPTAGDLNNLIDGVLGQVIPALRVLTSNQCHFYEITARDMETAFGAFVSRGIDLFGTNAGSSAPGNVSVVLSKRSGVPGRSNRGRFYTHDLNEGNLIVDTIDTTMASQLVNVAVGLLTRLVVSRFVPAIASRLGAYSLPITAIIIDTIADSMYRRLTGRGS